MSDETWTDRAALAIMAGFAADPGTATSNPTALAAVAYRWADALAAQRAIRARDNAQPAPPPDAGKEEP